ncbi:MAG: carboxypeptidase-like regulatory domain-containing protein, partial [Planctomycetota bacterium]|nr:carboxypeptidase-like regulatory domain-containing protein [Planctomycetota bacterium]
VVLWKKIEPTLAAAQAAQQNLASHRFEESTDEEGRVTFDVEDGEYFVQVPSYRLDPTPVQASSGQTDWQVMALPGTTVLEGRILNSDGSPVANTSLWLHSGDQDYSTMSLYYTDAAGRYSIENLAPKSYALSIIKSVADQSAQHVREVQGSGAPGQTFDVTFPPLTAAVHGRLTDGNGAGVPGVWIGVEFLDAPHRSILAGWVGTDATGHFQVPRLEPGRHILRTAWADFENVFSEEFVLAAGEDLEVNLTAPATPGKHVRGHMIAADGGPLGGNFVFITDGQGRQNGNFFSTMDWSYVGAFDASGLAPGNHTLELTAQGCQKQQFPVSVASDVAGLVVSMPRE